ncbi:NLR family CARD domain-containing protein 3-like [Sycon ciliatum]|uniref:NLR family CARD domain-containing protein 3-like n=1 Tax=Sycon ciliatum TaxID=27933 RepID=UPI0031F717C3
MDAKAQEPAAKRKALLPSLVKAKKKLLEQAEESGVQLSGGLASDDHIPLEQIFVNLAFLSEKELKRDFDEAFSTYAESREHAVQFSKADRIELKNLFRAAASSVDDVSHSKGKSAPAATATERPNLCGKVLRNVLAYGSAGSGKTTVFLLMVLYLWSRGELWQEEFDLVVGLELRKKEVRAATSLAELLAVKLASQGLSQTEILELANYFEDSPSRLCVIMDGLDECDFASCSLFMSDLLKREGMVKTHVIVTSRPCQDAYQLSQCGKYQQKIQVLGFSPENVREYAEKVLGRQRAEILLAELQNKPDVSCLMATPMFAALTCELFKSNNAVWKCSASLYESLLRRVVERAGGAVRESISLAPSKVVQSLQELGRFAFRMLLGKRMVFNTADVKNSHLSKDAMSLGLLQTCQGTMSTDVRQYRFCHLSLQEFLAAWFQAECVVKERHHAIALVRRLGAYDGHMAMFWKFLIALCPEDVSLTIMEELWRVQCADPIPLDPSGEADESTKRANRWASDGREERASNATTTATRHAATAARRAATAAKLAEDMRNDSSVLTGEMEMAKVHDRLCQILKAEHMTVLADILLIPRHDRGKGHGGERVRRSMPISREPTDALFLKTLLTVWMENGSVANGTVLLEALSQVDAVLARPCESLLHPAAMLLSRESLQAAPSGIVSLADAAAVAAHAHSSIRRLFVHLVVAYHEHAEYHGVSCNWTHPFFRTMLASKLILNGVSLSSHECVALSSLLRDYTCSDLEEVDLNFCRIGDESFHSLSAGLQRCSSVRVLDLDYNAIHDGQALSSVISAMSASLVVVSVTGNPVGVSGFVSVCRALSQCKNVHKVYALYMCSDGAAPLSVLCDMLEQCTQLKVLGLNGNVFVGCEDDELRFIEAVKVCTQLHILSVYDCGLSANVRSQLVTVFTEWGRRDDLYGV